MWPIIELFHARYKTHHVLEQLAVLTDFGGLREFIFILSTSSSPQPSAPPEHQTSHCGWSHERRGLTPGPQPQVKKHMTTTLVLFAHIWAQQASRDSRANTCPPMLRPNSKRYCCHSTSHPSPKTVFSLTSLYSGQSVKSKNDERGGGVSSTETIITLSRMSDQQLGSSRAYCGGLFRCCLGVWMII